MPHDYEDIFDIEDMGDDELRALVRETLKDNRSIDPTEIFIHVRDGMVILSGRVGTEEELRITERLLSDRLGLDEIQNQLVVDSLRRAESPEAVDEHIVDEQRNEGLLLGEAADREEDETRHLTPDENSELYGTVDINRSMEDGVPWVPPDSPTPEGTGDGTGTERDANRDSY